MGAVLFRFFRSMGLPAEMASSGCASAISNVASLVSQFQLLLPRASIEIMHFVDGRLVTSHSYVLMPEYAFVSSVIKVFQLDPPFVDNLILIAPASGLTLNIIL